MSHVLTKLSFSSEKSFLLLIKLFMNVSILCWSSEVKDRVLKKAREAEEIAYIPLFLSALASLCAHFSQRCSLARELSLDLTPIQVPRQRGVTPSNGAATAARWQGSERRHERGLMLMPAELGKGRRGRDAKWRRRVGVECRWWGGRRAPTGGCLEMIHFTNGYRGTFWDHLEDNPKAISHLSKLNLLKSTYQEIS